MYSKYSGVSIPQNYGGSRFSALSEVETKTHKPTLQTMPVKSSPPIVQYENYEKIEDNDQEDEVIDDEVLDIEELSQEEIESPLKALLSSIERDELILLGLILLLISDSSQNNTEVVMMLTLLLIGGK